MIALVLLILAAVTFALDLFKVTIGSVNLLVLGLLLWACSQIAGIAKR